MSAARTWPFTALADRTVIPAITNVSASYNVMEGAEVVETFSAPVDDAARLEEARTNAERHAQLPALEQFIIDFTGPDATLEAMRPRALTIANAILTAYKKTEVSVGE